MQMRFLQFRTACFALPVVLQFVACGGSRQIPKPDEQQVEALPIVVTIDPSQTLQTLEGFGASVAWYGERFTQHPNRDALAPILFSDLGFDILRLRNQHRSAGDAPDPTGIAIYRAAEASLGHPPRVLLTSWSPPRELKANGTTNCSQTDTRTTCTLLANADGSFPYEAFAQYWRESLEVYHAEGLDPYYISLQNEPDYKPTGWEGCSFNEIERDGLPGYDRALDAVSRSLAAAHIQTRIIGADTAHLQDGAVLRYAAAANPTQLYGLAHHLYDGSAWKNPDLFYSSMSDLAAAYPTLPKFQTEFSPTESGAAVEGGFEVAQLIHNSIAVEGASAYLHWELFWPNAGLVAIENPADRSKWTTPDGFQIREPYYSLRHFARYTDPGDFVVASQSSSAELLSTAYLSPDASRLTIVLLNVSSEAQTFTLDLSHFAFASSLAFRTTPSAPWQPGLPLDPTTTNQLQLEARSILTVVVSNASAPIP